MLRAKDNPFAVDRVQQIRYQPQEESWETLLARLETLHYRGAIIGPCGSGKTTLCEDMKIRLERSGFETRSLFISLDIRVPWPHIRSLLTESFDILLVDGADHLPRWTWQRLKRRIFKAKRGLIVTTHQPGLLPAWHHCRTSPDLLRAITERLLSDDTPLSAPRIEEVYRRHRGNIRDALRQLYDMAGSTGA